MGSISWIFCAYVIKWQLYDVVLATVDGRAMATELNSNPEQPSDPLVDGTVPSVVDPEEFFFGPNRVGDDGGGFDTIRGLTIMRTVKGGGTSAAFDIREAPPGNTEINGRREWAKVGCVVVRPETQEIGFALGETTAFTFLSLNGVPGDQLLRLALSSVYSVIDLITRYNTELPKPDVKKVARQLALEVLRLFKLTPP